MSHPFFDASRWPGSRPEAIALYRALSAAIQEAPRIRIFYDQSAEGLPGINFQQAYDVLWVEVLEKITSSGAFRKLCLIIKEAYPGNAALQKAIADIENAKGVMAMRIVDEDVLVLDRLQLRNALARIAPETTRAKIVLIRGHQKSGKSHAKHLFELMARENDAWPIYLTAGDVSTLNQVLNRLFGLFAVDAAPPPAGDSSAEAWYRAICAKLGSLALHHGKVFWIAMDDLGTDSDGAPLLDTSIKSFFDQLCRHMSDYTFRKFFRLMLIHYPDEQPGFMRPETYVAPDPFSDADIQQRDVEELLEDWRARSGKFLTDEMIREISAEIIAGAGAAHASSCRLQLVHDLLLNKIQQLQAS